MTQISLPKLNQTGVNEWADVEDNDRAIRDVVNGQLDDSNIAAGAAIATSKLVLPATVTSPIGTSSKAIIAATETTTSATYTTLTTPDQVAGVVLPTDGLIFIHYRALVSTTDASTPRAAVFLNGVQLKQKPLGSPPTGVPPIVSETSLFGGSSTPTYGWLYSVNTLTVPTAAQTALAFQSAGGGGVSVSDGTTTGLSVAEVVPIEAAAGTYTVSIRFKTPGQTVSVQDRRLRVWAQSFG